MKHTLSALLVILQCSLLLAAGGVGTTGANYLKIGLGAKATALGENFTALSDDASAPYWNAAGLTTSKKTRLDFMQLNWVAGISAKTFFGVYPLSDKDYIGGYAFMLDTPQDKETRYADSPVLEYEETGDSFKSAVGVYTVSYARLLSEQLSLGLSVKAIDENLAGTKARGFGLDLGLLYRELFPRTTVGVSIQNISGVKLRTEEELPRIFSVGALYETELWKNRLNVVGDIKIPNDNDMRYGVGAEYWIANIVAGRIGYNSFSKFSLGLGLAFKDIYADYAYVPLGDLGITHRIAVGYAFDIAMSRQVAQPVQEEVVVPATVESVVEEAFSATTDAVTAPAVTGAVETIPVPVVTESVAVTEDVFAVTSKETTVVPTAETAETTETATQSVPEVMPAGEIDF